MTDAPRVRWLAAALVVFCSGPLTAQSPAGSRTTTQGDSSGGTPIIRTIHISRSDLFDSTETRHWYARVANKLHFVTREGVVRRELLFAVGERYDSAKVAETARNLRQLYLFRRVQIDTQTTGGQFGIRVITKDGWSTKSDVRFRSTGGQTEWGATYSESNLLGTGSFFQIRYKKNPDRSSLLFGFEQPRFLAKTVRLSLAYDDRSDGKRAGIWLQRPFYTLATRSGISLYTGVQNEQVLRFFGGESVASDSLWRRYAIAMVDVAKAFHASSEGYLRGGIFAQIRRDDFVPVSLKENSPRSKSGTGGGYLEWRRAKFLVTRGFSSIGRDEDVDLSRTVRLGFTLAPKAFGYGRDGVGGFTSVRIGTASRSAFAFVDARANALWTAAGLDSGGVQLSGTLAMRPRSGHELLLHADHGWLKQPVPGSEYDLGFSLGPRAFPIHAFTGDREYFLTVEYRATVFSDLFRFVGVGVSAFGDNGGAWYAGNPRRTGSDVGLGLRLAPSRSAGLDPIRVDLAYRFRTEVLAKGWVVVIAKGFPFTTTMRP